MSPDPLATAEQVKDRLGRTLTDVEEMRIDALLRDASATVRRITGQDFTEATTIARLRLHSRHHEVRLPQRPVTAIVSVKNEYNATVPYTWDGLDRIRAWTDLPIANWTPPPHAKPWCYVLVEYAHGYAAEDMPDTIVGITCQITIRALGRRPEDAGLMQESIDGYSYQQGSAGAAGPFGLLPDEREALAAFTRVGGTAWTR